LKLFEHICIAHCFSRQFKVVSENIVLQLGFFSRILFFSYFYFFIYYYYYNFGLFILIVHFFHQKK